MPRVETVEYHYVITIQTLAPTGTLICTYANTLDLAPESSREDAFFQAFNYACERMDSVPATTYVMFWSLDPNAL